MSLLAALRHAVQLLADTPAGYRRLVLATDGQPHDIDIHDPRYLVEDARAAVADARRLGVTVSCACFAGAAAEPVAGLSRIFGARQVRHLDASHDLAALALGVLLA